MNSSIHSPYQRYTINPRMKPIPNAKKHITYSPWRAGVGTLGAQSARSTPSYLLRRAMSALVDANWPGAAAGLERASREPRGSHCVNDTFGWLQDYGSGVPPLCASAWSLRYGALWLSKQPCMSLRWEESASSAGPSLQRRRRRGPVPSGPGLARLTHAVRKPAKDDLATPVASAEPCTLDLRAIETCGGCHAPHDITWSEAWPTARCGRSPRRAARRPQSRMPAAPRARPSDRGTRAPRNAPLRCPGARPRRR